MQRVLFVPRDGQGINLGIIKGPPSEGVAVLLNRISIHHEMAPVASGRFAA